MNEVFFELASDFMAVGPAGSSIWTAINPALAKRLGVVQPNGFERPVDPSRLLASDGSYVLIDWTVHEADGTVYWVGRERTASIVRELHHRLKNNLQFVVSLLSFQSARLNAPLARVPFLKAESRIRAVARLHESAYCSPDLSQVEFAAYLRELVRDLSAGETPFVTLDASDVALPMEQAAPLGLIANELVSNAIEGASATVISVSLRYPGDGQLCLSVGHDGPASGQTDIGEEMIEVFVEQLRGTLSTEPSDRFPGGVNVSVTFPLSDD